MLGVYVSVPIACFRKGLAREFLETESIPPPATCYGFLLSLVGEMNRRRHVGCRVTPALLGEPPTSVVLRTVWRVKKPQLGASGNTRPDYQQLLTGIELVLWIDSSGESPEQEMTLEQRVTSALNDPSSVTRFGGLSLGESTHLVDEVSLLDRMESRLGTRSARHFLLADRGSMTLPVWVDHVGSAKTRYATGNLVVRPAIAQPSLDAMPLIHPEYAS